MTPKAIIFSDLTDCHSGHAISSSKLLLASYLYIGGEFFVVSMGRTSDIINSLQENIPWRKEKTIIYKNVAYDNVSHPDELLDSTRLIEHVDSRHVARLRIKSYCCLAASMVLLVVSLLVFISGWKRSPTRRECDKMLSPWCKC